MQFMARGGGVESLIKHKAKRNETPTPSAINRVKHSLNDI